MAQTQKEPHLAVYDYGQGGVWVLIDARSPDEIVAKYPELAVVSERPPWLSEQDLSQLMHFDIDAQPSGWLAGLVRNRPGRESDTPQADD